MPLSCLDGENQLLSFDLGQEEWADLAVRNRADRNLRFKCCESRVSLRTSKLGTRYFAHVAREGCDSEAESADHLRAKTIICRALQSVGWKFEPEKRLQDEDGLAIADVFGRKNDSPGTRGVAFEVQWSPQTAERSIERTNRYKAFDVRALWFFRQTEIPVSKEIPSVNLVKTDNEYFVRLPSGLYGTFLSAKDRLEDRFWTDPIPLFDFVRGAALGQFQFGLPTNVTLPIDVYGAQHKCRKCGQHQYGIHHAVLSLHEIAAEMVPRGYRVHSLANQVDPLSTKLKTVLCRVSKKHGSALVFREAKSKEHFYGAQHCVSCNQRYYEVSDFHHPERLMSREVITVTKDEIDLLCRSSTRWTYGATGAAKFERSKYKGASWIE